jgi:hypothetical protein
MGVYGSFISSFPELYTTLSVWTAADKSDIRTVRCVHIPVTGSMITRKKYSSTSWAGEISDRDELFIPTRYQAVFKEGDYVEWNNDTYRVIKALPYVKAADYAIYTIERVMGATAQQNAALPIKEPVFK